MVSGYYSNKNTYIIMIKKKFCRVSNKYHLGPITCHLYLNIGSIIKSSTQKSNRRNKKHQCYTAIQSVIILKSAEDTIIDFVEWICLLWWTKKKIGFVNQKKVAIRIFRFS